ncbi:hypothetical protein ABZU32_30165 [Sphaerisporangium sp. NPDC005288]|uniref:hypothetical protein n=1 Tax=Sphaerisporangium sp. NPDC005288 TaxID=3155114 RepID=UPI0033BC202C
MSAERPDYSRSRAILIGTSTYQDGLFPALPAGDQRFFNAPFTGAKLRFDSMAPGTYRYQTFIAGARMTG